MRGWKLGVVSLVPLEYDRIPRHFIMSISWTLREHARSIKKRQLRLDLPPLGMWSIEGSGNYDAWNLPLPASDLCSHFKT